MDAEAIRKIIEESIEAKRLIPVLSLLKASEAVFNCYKNGGKLLVCGNGGSAADAQHMAGEFVNRFKIERSPLPCIALTTDTSILTAVANDYSFDEVFSKQVEAYGKTGDILIGISTSGKSKNIIKAMGAAKKNNMFTVCFLGNDGGTLKNMCDLPIIVSSHNTPRIQEAHILIMHVICELVEKEINSPSRN